jgi:O-acetyl-ADP-ribose deacetylase (regulator of RNase III)
MHVFATGELTSPKYVINFPTKHHWRGKSKVEDIESGLRTLRSLIEERGIRSIAVPPLGCGNGGLDWTDVYPRIEEALQPLADTVDILVFAPGKPLAAVEMKVRTSKPKMTAARALYVKLVQTYSEGGYSLSLLEIQKLAYFLQEAGQQLKLNYVKHYYGPYADNLNHVLQRLEGHYIRGYGDRSSDAAIALVPEAVTEADDFLSTDNEAVDRTKRVSALIEGFETPFGLELLASVHWVVVKDEIRAETVENAVELIRDWSPRKCRLFKREHVDTAWHRLRRNGWLPKCFSGVETV